MNVMRTGIGCGVLLVSCPVLGRRRDRRAWLHSGERETSVYSGVLKRTGECEWQCGMDIVWR